MENSSSISKLYRFIENPENCFDYYLLEHKQRLNELSVLQLKFLVQAREHCCKLNSIHKIDREKLELCIKEGVVDPKGLFSQVYDDFTIADSFFGE